MLRTSHRVMERAKSICENQPEMPQSPGTVDKQGNISLCAAAAIAAARLEIYNGSKERREFELKVAESRSTNVLIDTFEKIGWGREMCKTIILVNDEIPPSMRRERVISYIDEISEVMGTSTS